MTHIRQTFIQERRLYAPAYFRLVEDQKLSPSPFKPIASSRHKDKRSKGKGVARVDEEFNKEREWLLQRLKSDKEVKDAEREGHGEL